MSMRRGNSKGHSKADGKVHTREECAIVTRTGAKVKIQTNSHPINAVIERKSLRTERVYDWQKGTSETRAMDVITNAQRQINRAKVTPVTNGRRRNMEEDTRGPLGYPAVPTLGGRY